MESGTEESVKDIEALTNTLIKMVDLAANEKEMRSDSSDTINQLVAVIGAIYWLAFEGAPETRRAKMAYAILRLLPLQTDAINELTAAQYLAVTELLKKHSSSRGHRPANDL